jgi:tetratricopeptide (TPR) repeat protein
MWTYLRMILIPRLSEFGLFHDDLAVSRGLFQPPTTALSLSLLLASAVGALLVRNRLPLLAFGVLFFLSAHALESSVFALEIAHEHRNYVASLGVYLPVAYFVFAHPWKHRLVYALRAALIAVIALGAYATAVRADTWSDALRHATFMVRFHPDSARSSYQLGSIYWELYLSAPEHYEEFARRANGRFLRSAELWPYNRAGYLIASFVVLDRLGEAPDREHSSRVVDDLATRPISDFTVNGLVNLLDCQATGECSIDPAVTFELAETAASNERARKKGRARVLASAAQYALRLGELERAIALAETAMDYYPSHLQHALNLSLLYIEAGRIDEARALLDTVRRRDSTREFGDKIAYQAGLIRSLRRAAPQDTMLLPQVHRHPATDP